MDKLLKLLIVLSMLAAMFLAAMRTADASDYSFRGGPGIRNGSPTGSMKYFGIRQEQKEFYNVYSSYELGGWSDQLEGHKSSLVGKLQIGINPGPAVGLYGKAFIGVAAISQTDVLLGGNAQFCEDIGFGVRDLYTQMEITYSHFSSAGIFKPNVGRDFLLFSAGVKF